MSGGPTSKPEGAALPGEPLDVPLALENMLIAATSLGLGAAWIGGFRRAEAAKALHRTATRSRWGCWRWATRARSRRFPTACPCPTS
jgi:hypothetical protein